MLDRKRIEEVTGVEGTMIDDVLKLSVPRSDIRVMVDGFEIIPFMGTTSWAAFRGGSEGVTVMGDIVVLEDEIDPAMKAAIDGGLYVTALHNHFVREAPRAMFMHVEGTAEDARLARAIGEILRSVAAVRRTHVIEPTRGSVDSGLDIARLDEIVGHRGEAKDGVYKFTIGRPEAPVRCTQCGNLPVNAAMGYNTWAAFQGREARAAVCGDVAMLEEEVTHVIHALHDGGIEVVAVHNHMFFESPRTVFLHYWGVGPATQLAETFRGALDRQQAVMRDGSCHHE